MVETVSDIKREFGICAAVIRTLLNSPFHVDNQIAGNAVFAGHRVAAETDDIGRTVFSEKLAVIRDHAGVVRQQQGDFLPDGFRITRFQCGGQFSGQPADCRKIDPAFLPVYQ